MRFLLINPFYPISETPSPPLGLAFLGAALEKEGVDVKIYDLVVSPYNKQELEDLLMGFSPDMVGVTSVTMTFDEAMGVLKDVKSINSKIPTVMGGPHVTFCAEETLKAYPELDFIVFGEGESTIVELIMALEAGSNWGVVEGIAYREGDKIVKTEVRRVPLDMNDLPVPARHLIPLGRYRALSMPISMTTSRGCPFQCIFCVGRKMVGPIVRYRDPVDVVDEMEYLTSLNFHQINIADDLFTANSNHCIAVCEEIEKRGLETKWTSFARVDTVSTKILRHMKEAGCQAVSFGIESANSQILKTVKKGINIDQVLEAVTKCLEIGITPQASFILGLPGETPDTIKENLDFGKKLKSMGVLFGYHLLAPFPGSEVRENIDKYDVRVLTNDWREYHANRAIVETASVDKEMLNDIVIEWEDEFNSWLGEIKRRMEVGEATDDEALQITKLESAIFIYDLMMANVIENKGTWPKSNENNPDPLRDLVEKIKDTTDLSPNQVYNVLEKNVKQGNLKCADESGMIKWGWVDYL